MIRHHTIVVASSHAKALTAAHAAACRLFSTVSPVVVSALNGYQSFFVAPDGSHEEYAPSEDADKARDRFVREVLERLKDSAGTPLVAWAEVRFGDEEDKNFVTRCSHYNRDSQPVIDVPAVRPPQGA